jgi:MFS family permease
VAEPVTEPAARLVRFGSLAALRNPAYARLWTGAFVSNIGTWMESIALGIYITDKTNQAAWTGTVAAASFVPIAFFGPLGGALADRLPRKWLLVGTSLFQAGLAFLLTFLFAVGEPSGPVIAVIALGNGVAAALGFPAFQAILPDLVPLEDLPGAIALSSAQFNLGRVIGPVVAGVVISVGGYAWAEAGNAISFLAVVAVVLTLTLPPPTASRAERLLRAIADGFRYVRDEPGLRVNAAAMFLNTLLAAPFIALVPAMAQKVLDSGTFGTSVLVTAQGIGAVTVALMLGSLTPRWGARRVLVFMMGWLPLALTAYALAPTLAVSAAALMVVGALYLGALATFTTVAQIRAPQSIRGRVLAVHMVMLGALYPLGAVVQGAISDHVGLRATTASAAALMALVMLVTRITRPGITAAIDAPVEAPAEAPVDTPGAAREHVAPDEPDPSLR